MRKSDGEVGTNKKVRSRSAGNERFVISFYEASKPRTRSPIARSDDLRERSLATMSKLQESKEGRKGVATPGQATNDSTQTDNIRANDLVGH